MIVAHGEPELRAQAQTRSSADGLRLLLQPGRGLQPACPFDYAPGRLRRAYAPAATTPSSPRAAIATTSGSPAGQLPAKALLRRAGARSRPPATGPGRSSSRRRDPDLPRHPRLRGRLPLRRRCGRPDLGRRHVRGADADLFVPEERWGAAQLGREPPADRARADPARAGRGRLRLLGLLAVEHPGGRLQRLRRRRASA